MELVRDASAEHTARAGGSWTSFPPRQQMLCQLRIPDVGVRRAAAALALASLSRGPDPSLMLARWARLAAAPAELNLLGFRASIVFDWDRARDAAACAPA